MSMDGLTLVANAYPLGKASVEVAVPSSLLNVVKEMATLLPSLNFMSMVAFGSMHTFGNPDWKVALLKRSVLTLRHDWPEALNATARNTRARRIFMFVLCFIELIVI
jgi:t-SNARE complex subunit (syntaxin)